MISAIAITALVLAVLTITANVRRQFWLVRMQRRMDSHEAEMRAKWAEVVTMLGIKGE